MVDPNSRTWLALGLAADVVVVNALTIVCSLPVVTAGAALSAAHGTLLEMVREEGAKPARTYFSYFTRTWRTATFGWLLLLAVGSVLGWEYWALGRMDGGAALVAQAGVLAGAILVTLWAVWFFPLASRGEGFARTAKLAALLALGKLPRSLLASVWLLIPAVLIILNPGGWVLWLAVMAIIGVALMLYLVDLVVVETIDSLPPRGSTGSAQ